MTNLQIIQKLRRLHTLLVLGKRSNNLALAIRKALELIASWHNDVDQILEKTPVKQIFAGYGPKFIKLFNELINTGDIQMIQELQTDIDPFFCFLCEIPGIGETMARRMFFDKSIRSMDDLRIAYSNCVLQRIPAFGDTRLHAIERVLWKSQNPDQSWEDEEDDLNSLISQTTLTPVDETPSRQFELFDHHSDQKTQDHNSASFPASQIDDSENNDDESCDKDETLFSQDLLKAMTLGNTDDSNPELTSPSGFHAYPQDFIASNSVLFREPEAPSNFDQKVSDELHRFIEKDLREHGIPTQTKNTAETSQIRAERILAQTIHAKQISADIIQVRQLRVHSIEKNNNVTLISSAKDILNDSDIRCLNLTANTVQADLIDAESVQARLILAALIQLI